MFSLAATVPRRAAPLLCHRLPSVATALTAACRPLQPSFSRLAAPSGFLACRTMSASATPRKTAIFVCDIQEKFRNAIFQFDQVVATSRKVLRAAAILDIPVFVTTQNRLRLGNTVPELTSLMTSADKDAAPGPGPGPGKARVVVDADKTRFSMCVPSVQQALEPDTAVVLVGIESHICITQTALDLRANNRHVYVLADGVSSCNRQEVPVALDRLRAAGVIVTTSESWLYEHIGDASRPEFRNIVSLVKETSAETKTALSILLARM